MPGTWPRPTPKAGYAAGVDVHFAGDVAPAYSLLRMSISPDFARMSRPAPRGRR